MPPKSIDSNGLTGSSGNIPGLIKTHCIEAVAHKAILSTGTVCSRVYRPCNPNGKSISPTVGSFSAIVHAGPLHSHATYLHTLHQKMAIRTEICQNARQRRATSLQSVKAGGLSLLQAWWGLQTTTWPQLARIQPILQAFKHILRPAARRQGLQGHAIRFFDWFDACRPVSGTIPPCQCWLIRNGIAIISNWWPVSLLMASRRRSVSFSNTIM